MNLRRYFTRRQFLAAGGLGLAAVGLYAWRVEPHWLEVVRRAMSVRNLPQELVGAKLLHASDLHVGPQVDDAYLAGVFDRIRELAPEFVVYTGDFVSYNTDLREHAPRMLAQIACGTLGTFGILGNHDYGSACHDLSAARTVATLAERAGVRVLRNESTTVRGLTVVGLDDLWADRFQLGSVVSQLNSRDATIALVHNPDAVDQSGWGQYSGWILAGHTHGGQCKPPFLPPPLLPVRNRRYTCGEFVLSDGRRLYISRGVGHLLQVRFNVRPELTLFELTRES